MMYRITRLTRNIHLHKLNIPKQKGVLPLMIVGLSLSYVGVVLSDEKQYNRLMLKISTLSDK
jgi:hypothetical protein